MNDDKHCTLTMAAIAACAFIAADMSHEGLGHALVALISGSHRVVLSYTYLSSDMQSRWISAAGPLVNLAEGSLAFGLLSAFKWRANISYFLVLLTFFNLLVAAAYLVYSGILNSGDLAVVVAGLPHRAAVNAGMVCVGGALYWAFVVMGSRLLRRFQPPHITLVATAYFVALALNCCAALLNPLGLHYFLISALPATLAANAGVFGMAGLSDDAPHDERALQILRSYGWISSGLLASILYVVVIGPGLTLRQ
jgi:hypothetical protein